MGVRELAAAARVSVDTVARFERGDELKERTVDAIRQALEVAGVEFTNGERPGVRLAAAAPAVHRVTTASNLTKANKARRRASKKPNDKSR
jgi:hypothetical protein